MRERQPTTGRTRGTGREGDRQCESQHQGHIQNRVGKCKGEQEGISYLNRGEEAMVKGGTRTFVENDLNFLNVILGVFGRRDICKVTSEVHGEQ